MSDISIRATKREVFIPLKDFVFNPKEPQNAKDTAYNALWMRPKDAPLTGEDSTIAIIDVPMPRLSTYRANLLSVEAVNGANFNVWPLSGPASTSIAVGETGVAQKANVVYRAIRPASPDKAADEQEDAFLCDAVCALFSLQTYMEKGGNIDAICLPYGWDANAPRAPMIQSAINRMEKNGIPVFSVNSIEPHVIGCGKNGFSQSTQKEAGAVISQFKNAYPAAGKINQTFVPIDRPILAGFPTWWPYSGLKDPGITYYWEEGSLRRAVPLLTGLYATALDVVPSLTMTDFFAKLRATAKNIDFGDGYPLPVVNMDSFMKEVHLPVSAARVNPTTPPPAPGQR
jgi:hypothetical protein